jgi:hypothetical protein
MKSTFSTSDRHPSISQDINWVVRKSPSVSSLVLVRVKESSWVHIHIKVPLVTETFGSLIGKLLTSHTTKFKFSPISKMRVNLTRSSLAIECYGIRYLRVVSRIKNISKQNANLRPCEYTS